MAHLNVISSWHRFSVRSDLVVIALYDDALFVEWLACRESGSRNGVCVFFAGDGAPRCPLLRWCRLTASGLVFQSAGQVATRGEAAQPATRRGVQRRRRRRRRRTRAWTASRTAGRIPGARTAHGGRHARLLQVRIQSPPLSALSHVTARCWPPDIHRSLESSLPHIALPRKASSNARKVSKNGGM